MLKLPIGNRPGNPVSLPNEEGCMFAVRLGPMSQPLGEMVTFRILDNRPEAHRLQRILLSLAQQDIMVSVERIDPG